MGKLKSIKIRSFLQLIMLAAVTIAAFNHYLSSIGSSIPWISESVFHYICPICGVTSIYQFITSSSLFVIKLKSTLGIVLGLVIISSVLFGPIICGYICPFGAIQDFTAKVGKKIFKGKYNTFILAKVHNKLKYLRYLILMITIALTTFTSGILFLEKINPYHGYLSLFNKKFSLTGFIILLVILITSLFIQRPWCNYLCPYGAFLGLFNKIKVFRIVRKKSTCVGCKKCTRQCPMNIKVNTKEEVRDLACISCLECVSDGVCPKEKTIYCSSEDI